MPLCSIWPSSELSTGRSVRDSHIDTSGFFGPAPLDLMMMAGEEVPK